MGILILSSDQEAFIEHYGVKGMRWGVRRYKSKASKAGAVARKLMVGNEKTSLATKRGRKSFKSNVKSDVEEAKRTVNKLLNNKAFKAIVYNHENATKLARMSRDQVNDLVKLLK